MSWRPPKIRRVCGATLNGARGYELIAFGVFSNDVLGRERVRGV